LSYFSRERDFMASAQKLTIRLSTKGQVILPKSIRERRHWDAGTRLVIEDTVDGVLLKAAPSFEPTRPDEVFGSLKVSGSPKTLEEMDAGVLAEARHRHARD
jgi:AbrB family looped-hinge helix DNA binding protein